LILINIVARDVGKRARITSARAFAEGALRRPSSAIPPPDGFEKADVWIRPAAPFAIQRFG
jgi:hypothetical protein